MYLVISTSSMLFVTALALVGYGFAFFSLSTVVQGLLIAVSPDAFHGRVMGLYTMLTAGGVPIATLIGGTIGSVFGPGEAVAVAAAVMLAFLGGSSPGGGSGSCASTSAPRTATTRRSRPCGSPAPSPEPRRCLTAPRRLQEAPRP